MSLHFKSQSSPTLKPVRTAIRIGVYKYVPLISFKKKSISSLVQYSILGFSTLSLSISVETE